MIIPPLKKSYKGQAVLNLPGFEIKDGSILAVCGQNGCGKSTLGKLLAGIIKDDSGKTAIPGISTGYMTQTSFPFNLSVLSNLMQNADKSLTKEENKEKALALLKALGIDSLKDKNAKKLSGGETEKMSLARLLMKDYDLLILDEPTAAMDTASIPLAEQLVKNYHERTGCTVILITHSPGQAERMADEIKILEKI